MRGWPGGDRTERSCWPRVGRSACATAVLSCGFLHSFCSSVRFGQSAPPSILRLWENLEGSSAVLYRAKGPVYVASRAELSVRAVLCYVFVERPLLLVQRAGGSGKEFRTLHNACASQRWGPARIVGGETHPCLSRHPAPIPTHVSPANRELECADRSSVLCLISSACSSSQCQSDLQSVCLSVRRAERRVCDPASSHLSSSHLIAHTYLDTPCRRHTRHIQGGEVSRLIRNIRVGGVRPRELPSCCYAAVWRGRRVYCEGRCYWKKRHQGETSASGGIERSNGMGVCMRWMDEWD